MTYTYEQLHRMTVAQLREIARNIEHEAVKGFSTMHKEKLVPALCHALGIEAHAHHQVVGLDKSKIKLEIRRLKRERDAAITGKDPAGLRAARVKIKELKRQLRKATI